MLEIKIKINMYMSLTFLGVPPIQFEQQRRAISQKNHQKQMFLLFFMCFGAQSDIASIIM